MCECFQQHFAGGLAVSRVEEKVGGIVTAVDIRAASQKANGCSRLTRLPLELRAFPVADDPKFKRLYAIAGRGDGLDRPVEPLDAEAGTDKERHGRVRRRAERGAQLGSIPLPFRRRSLAGRHPRREQVKIRAGHVIVAMERIDFPLGERQRMGRLARPENAPFQVQVVAMPGAEPLPERPIGRARPVAGVGGEIDVRLRHAVEGDDAAEGKGGQNGGQVRKKVLVAGRVAPTPLASEMNRDFFGLRTFPCPGKKMHLVPPLRRRQGSRQTILLQAAKGVVVVKDEADLHDSHNC